MLVRFSVENYLSFREKQTIDFMAVRTCKERRDENTFAIGKDDALLKVVALYGANASGKSNLFMALRSMLLLVSDSFSDSEILEYELLAPFMFEPGCLLKPSVFELEFIIGERWYKYGFATTNKDIHKEWLYSRTGASGKMKQLFIRLNDGVEDSILPSDDFVGADEVVVEKTRPNALFLSTCAGLAVKEAMDIVKHLREKVMYVSTHARSMQTASLFVAGKLRDNILQLLRKTDPCIDDLIVEPYDRDTGRTRPSGEPIVRRQYRVFVIHKGQSEDPKDVVRLPLYALGSLGTRKAFELAGPLYVALSTGATILIDELDSRLHPILTREIIKLFNSTANNPMNAQLVFNTHDTNLLSCKSYNAQSKKRECVLRRDQVYFAERTGDFASRIYSLIDFKDENGASVRNDASYEKDYLDGRYGSIPFIGELSLLKEDGHGKTEP